MKSAQSLSLLILFHPVISVRPAIQAEKNMRSLLVSKATCLTIRIAHPTKFQSALNSSRIEQAA